MIADNLNQIYKNIQTSAAKSGQKYQDITVVCVTKNRSVEEIRQAIACGIENIGENRVQEAFEKYPQIAHKVRWHMVGHLQSNKVKRALDIFSMIHSLDSLKLAQEIDQQSKRLDKTLDVLVQVNTSGEEAKFGVSLFELDRLFKDIVKLNHIRIKGLMTMAPLVKDPEAARPCFGNLREAKDRLQQKFPDLDLGYLSMGMSQDYTVAVEEGANILRIGSAIFEG